MIIFLVLVSIYLVYYDIRFKKVPNNINLILFSSLFIYKYLTDGDIISGLISGAVASLVFFVTYLITRGKMGMGDAKYTGIIAFHFGIYFWLQSIIVCSITAILVSVTLLLTKKISRATAIPFIPFLVSGWIINLFLNSPL